MQRFRVCFVVLSEFVQQPFVKVNNFDISTGGVGLKFNLFSHLVQFRNEP
jgi:hypothetical protein